MAPTLAIISPGAMGAAVARRLTTSRCTVLTDLRGRSDATRKHLISPLPESLAQDVQSTLATIEPRQNDLIYVDCNAVNPSTVKRIQTSFLQHNKSATNRVKFIDGSIIGGPPKDGYDPAFYASVDQGDEDALSHFLTLRDYGMRIIPLEGPSASIGDASSLKMCYAGISKGFLGLLMTMTLTAAQSSPATLSALLSELEYSNPRALEGIASGVIPAIPKAYRWVGEMKEIANFVDTTAEENSGRNGDNMGDIYKGFANLFGRLEDDENARNVLKDVAALAKQKTEK
ncbi:6-phosphogluconate dehydrogenase C-terminal domain-like protein [Flagelloscypha sp. PMI_526]|nr:6-phosphogluconate dehydrogenase C-terminal domain-like protein [Flagelloscypha sp. PMI_526]